jgi:hypothetical protein
MFLSVSGASSVAVTPSIWSKPPTKRGWSALSNGTLLAAAEAEGFDLLVTSDQNLTRQQNLAGRRIRVAVLWTNRWRLLQADADRVELIVESR